MNVINYARYECEKASIKFDCPLIRINPEKPEIRRAAEGVEHVSITDSAEVALKKIDELILQMREK